MESRCSSLATRSTLYDRDASGGVLLGLWVEYLSPFLGLRGNNQLNRSLSQLIASPPGSRLRSTNIPFSPSAPLLSRPFSFRNHSECCSARPPAFGCSVDPFHPAYPFRATQASSFLWP